MSEPADKIDDVAFAQGREAFDRGVSLRAIVEAVRTADADVAAETRAFSYALGFADALLDRIRQPVIIGEPVDPPGDVFDFAKQSIGGA